MNKPAITLEEIIKAAHTHLDKKEFGAAGVLLTLIQEKYPEQPDCLHAMGVIALEANQNAHAENLLRRALVALSHLPNQELLTPARALFLAHYGRALYLCDDLPAALVTWLRSLNLQENEQVREWYRNGHEEALRLGEKITKKIAEFESTRELESRSGLKVLKAALDKKNNRSVSPSKKSNKRPDPEVVSRIQHLVDVGGIENAKAIEPLCQVLLSQFPDLSDTYHWMAISMLYQRRHHEALEWVNKAIEKTPWHPFYQNTKGVILKRCGTLIESAECFRQVLRLKPDYAEVHQNLANILRDEGEYAEAEGWYLRALELKEYYPECINNLGILNQQQKKYEKSIEYFTKAASLRKDYPNPHLNLGVVYESLKDRKKAVDEYRETLRINPMVHEAWLSLLHSQMHLCDWDGLEQGIATVKRLVTEGYPGELMPFNFLALPGSSALEQRRCGELFVNVRYEQFIRQGEKMGFAFPRERRNKIKIGYLSADYRQHAVAVSIVQIFEKHDRDKFEVFAYGYTPDDGSDVRKRIVSSTNFVDLENYSFLDAARKIHGDGIDILIDLTAYTSNGRSEIMALRPAPIQVNYLGYPSTMAAPFVDYLIGDPVITPFENAHHFTEKLALLPHCYFPNDRERKVTQGITRDQEGLPEKAFVFCSFNQPYKITPQLWDVWCDLLLEIPGSILWLHAFEEIARANLRRSLEQKGIDPNRLYFAGVRKNLEDHLGRLALADLALDTIPYNGHTTTSDALWAGLPVLTCPGETFASRVAASILNAANVPELIASSLKEYKQRAIAMATDPGQIGHLKQKISLNRNTCPLYDSVRMTRNLERIYFEMYENWISGNEPKPIRIFDEE